MRAEQAELSRDPGADVLAGTAEHVTLTGRRPLEATITPAYARREIFAPGLPSTISQVSRLRIIGAGGHLAGIERDPSSAPYTVTTLVTADEKDGGWTEERLRAAGQDYPAEIVALYGKDTLPDGSLGPQSTALLSEILQNAPSNNPYDLAIEIRDTLLDTARFEYDTDLSDRPCVDTSIVECFVVNKAGFCQYYASTMTVFLRELGIPARFVEGFLPGEPDASGGGRHRPCPRRPRLGAGLLPGLRLDRLRSDRRSGAPGRSRRSRRAPPSRAGHRDRRAAARAVRPSRPCEARSIRVLAVR